MQLSNHLNLMYETDSVDTQVQIVTENSLLALDTFALIGREINKKATCFMDNRNHKNLKSRTNIS